LVYDTAGFLGLMWMIHIPDQTSDQTSVHVFPKRNCLDSKEKMLDVLLSVYMSHYESKMGCQCHFMLCDINKCDNVHLSV